VTIELDQETLQMVGIVIGAIIIWGIGAVLVRKVVAIERTDTPDRIGASVLWLIGSPVFVLMAIFFGVFWCLQYVLFFGRKDD
jgi:hypothetical protein